MGPVARITAAYRRTDAWIRAHPRVNLALLIVVPAATMAVTAVLLGVADPFGAVGMGLAFGIVYGSLTYFWGDLGDRPDRIE